MGVIKTLRATLRHPLNQGHPLRTVQRYLTWQFGARLAPGPIVVPWVNGARILVRHGEHGLTGNIYCGLEDFVDMSYVLHTLSDRDMFVDVGANAGSYTVLACASRGARGIAIEPVPTTFARLIENTRINSIEGRVRCLNVGVSDKPGALRFSCDEDCENHVVLESKINRDAGQASIIETEVRTLDSILNLEADSPSLIKIDVEGFEKPVLDGAAETLARDSLHSLIVEMNGSGTRYGYEEADIYRLLNKYDFVPCRYDPAERRLEELDAGVSETRNVLFVRNRARVASLLCDAPPYVVAGVEI